MLSLWFSPNNATCSVQPTIFNYMYVSHLTLTFLKYLPSAVLLTLRFLKYLPSAVLLTLPFLKYLPSAVLLVYF